MSKFIQLQDEVYVTLLRYSNAIDRLWQHSEVTREVVRQHFGDSHSPMVLDALNWLMQRQAAAKLQLSQNAPVNNPTENKVDEIEKK